MSIKTSIEVERAERIKIGRRGTVRERTRVASDVAVIDLSTTGVRFTAEPPLEIGALVSLGIPGLGMQAARVMRVNGIEHGAAFLMPISAEDVVRAGIAETVAEGNFPQMRDRIRTQEAIAYNRRATDREIPEEKPGSLLGKMRGLFKR
ncbi:PilZ domain-containing protein [Sphingomonas morindae]|uniref:PilZ domain-containing protein n=1 Tax=Sphingomonas morindae TaxID=1541170 RepID=A0ABY4XA57_9SPHN|nr:PilZ domain-containing protein [Sphingomonas morindae]USI73857.1 PilZ domain-containing protein [Sphingomonas morindae]